MTTPVTKVGAQRHRARCSQACHLRPFPEQLCVCVGRPRRGRAIGAHADGRRSAGLVHRGTRACCVVLVVSCLLCSACCVLLQHTSNHTLPTTPYQPHTSNHTLPTAPHRHWIFGRSGRRTAAGRRRVRCCGPLPSSASTNGRGCCIPWSTVVLHYCRRGTPLRTLLGIDGGMMHGWHDAVCTVFVHQAFGQCIPHGQ